MDYQWHIIKISSQDIWFEIPTYIYLSSFDSQELKEKDIDNGDDIPVM